MSSVLDKLSGEKPKKRCHLVKAANHPAISIREPALRASSLALPTKSKGKAANPASSGSNEDMVLIVEKERSKSR